MLERWLVFFFFFQAEDGIRDATVTGVQTCALPISTEAVIQTGKRTVVIVAQGDGKFAPVDVEIGIETGGQTEIRSGLEAGQKVVVSGQFLIDSESSLRATGTRMGEVSAPGASDAAAATHRGT